MTQHMLIRSSQEQILSQLAKRHWVQQVTIE